MNIKDYPNLRAINITDRNDISRGDIVCLTEKATIVLQNFYTSYCPEDTNAGQCAMVHHVGNKIGIMIIRDNTLLPHIYGEENCLWFSFDKPYLQKVVDTDGNAITL